MRVQTTRTRDKTKAHHSHIMYKKKKKNLKRERDEQYEHKEEREKETPGGRRPRSKPFGIRNRQPGEEERSQTANGSAVILSEQRGQNEERDMQTAWTFVKITEY